MKTSLAELRHVALIAAVVLFNATAHAAPYADLIVFGDSLSDVGNTDAATFGFQPGSDYFEGRFSNGPTYAELLSAGLELGELTRDEEGGDNYAYGGAETDGPGFFGGGSFINSFVEQVDTYLDRIGASAPDSSTLFVVFIGSNDFLLADQTDPAIPAAVVRDQFERLIDAGAKQFLGINLPLLGLTPDEFGNEALSNRARAYNAELAGIYNDIELDNADVTVHRLDVQTLLSDLLADPLPFGFTNVTNRGQDQPGDSFDRAPGFAFWDGVHPTRELHALLGEAAIRAVLPAGDYDRDGIVSPDDNAAWRDAYGTTFNAALGQTPSLAADGNGDGRIDAADYTLWRDRFSSPPVAVPEPTALVVAAIGFAMISVSLRRA